MAWNSFWTNLQSNGAVNPMNVLKTAWANPLVKTGGYIGAGGLALGAASGLVRDDRGMIGNTFGAAGKMITSGLTWGAMGAAGGAAWGTRQLVGKWGAQSMSTPGRRAAMGKMAMRGGIRGGIYGALGGMAWGGIRNAFF